MSWRCYLGDTTTGLIDRPIDLPSFSWSVDVGDSSLSTNSDKGAGTDSWSSITVPWTAIKETDAAGRGTALATMRRCITLFWTDDDTEMGTPILWGAIGTRTDSWLDTSFSLSSMMDILTDRYLCNEGDYGTDTGGTTTGTIRFEDMSYRAIMCQCINVCTTKKPGGALPLDLPYLNESGSRAREYSEYDIQNNSCATLIKNLTNVDNGPDVQFIPYMSDSQHVRVRFEAGSDDEVYLGQDVIHTLTSFPGGGTIHDLSITHSSPVMRVYASGGGDDEAQLCYLAEDLTLTEQGDPWPLVESTYSDSDTDTLSVLESHAEAQLEANSKPILQISGDVDFNDPRVPSPGTFWPGHLVDLAIDGFPSLPDGTYRCRLMEMSGDQSSVATLTFDVMEDPIY